jgi:hypothetical protein
LLSGVPANPRSYTTLSPLFLDTRGSARTPLAQIYLRTYDKIAKSINRITGELNTGEEITDNQGAECLYMVITTATGDGEARSQFSENNIGDVDGDGAPEFLDGWGNPISFLRWAPGFDSDIQLNAVELENMASAVRKQAIDGDHDPFDMYRRDSSAYRLTPLIYSAGRDEEYGINNEKPYVTWVKPSSPAFNSTPPPFFAPQSTPYPYLKAMPNSVYIGSDNGEGVSVDNIHNHLISGA